MTHIIEAWNFTQENLSILILISCFILPLLAAPFLWIHDRRQHEKQQQALLNRYRHK